MKRNLYIFRHGETDWNIAKKMQGIADIPLNEHGIAQAHDLADKLSNVHFDCIYTSSLSRAVQTAKIVASKNKTKIITLDGLWEWNLGIFSGKILHLTKKPKWTPIRFESDNVYIPRTLLLDGDYVPENGESYNMFKKRVCETIENIIKNTNAENIGIATHGGVIRALLREYTNFTQAHGGMPNAGYFVLQWDGKKFQILEKPDWLVRKHPVVLAIDFVKKVFHTR